VTEVLGVPDKYQGCPTCGLDRCDCVGLEPWQHDALDSLEGYIPPSDESEDKEMEAATEVGNLRKPPPKPGVERAEFPLPEGVVRLEFPASLSTASYEDFKAWVELALRRAKRGVSNEDEAAD
jgi:hypothetical protein